MSCTSCEDERNALCATRKAADGILGLDSLCQLEWQKLETKQSAERRPLGNDVIVLFRLSRGYSQDSNRILLCNVFQHFTADRTKITSAASYRFLVLFSETFEQVLTQIQWSLVFESAPPRQRGPVSFLRWFEGFLAKAQWLTVSRLSINSRLTACRLIGLPTVNRQSTDSQSTVGRQSADRSTNCRSTFRPTVNRQGAKVHMSQIIYTIPILTTSPIHFTLKGWENVLFELGSERARVLLHVHLIFYLFSSPCGDFPFICQIQFVSY